MIRRPNKTQPPASEERKAALKARTEMKWKTLPWEEISAIRRYDRLLMEQDGKCLECGIPTEWNGKSLRFQIDHKSGVRTDNSRENVQLLCPNCHTQTPNWGVKNASEEGKKRLGWSAGLKRK